MKVGSLEWYRILEKTYSVWTITSNTPGLEDYSTTVYLLVDGIKYSIPLEELDKWKTRN